MNANKEIDPVVNMVTFLQCGQVSAPGGQKEQERPLLACTLPRQAMHRLTSSGQGITHSGVYVTWGQGALVFIMSSCGQVAWACLKINPCLWGSQGTGVGRGWNLAWNSLRRGVRGGPSRSQSRQQSGASSLEFCPMHATPYSILSHCSWRQGEKCNFISSDYDESLLLEERPWTPIDRTCTGRCFFSHSLPPRWDCNRAMTF